MGDIGRLEMAKQIDGKQIIQEYLDGLKTGFEVTPLPNEDQGVLIGTPFLMPDNDGIEIYAYHLPGGKVRFSDGGETLAWLWRSGLDQSPVIMRDIQRIAKGNRVKLDGDLLCVDAVDQANPLHDLLQVIISVSYMIERRREITQPDDTQSASGSTGDIPSSSGNAGASILEMFDRIRRDHPEPDGYVPPPSDLAKNYKHYFYGFPKEEDE